MCRRHAGSRPHPQAPELKRLRAALGGDLPASWDDIALLRFCLSFTGDAAKQESSVRACIAWRAKNAAMLDAVATGTPLPKDALIKSLCLTDYHGATQLGEPVSIVRAGLCSPPALLAVVSSEEFAEWLLYQKEVSFRICDAATRKSRLLVKCITVVDLLGVTVMSASSSASIQYQKIVAETGKISEFVYPQLLGRQILLHPPRFFAAIFSVIKQFMSERVVEKLGFCPGPGEQHGNSASVCPYASRRFDLATLPSFLGGTCKCTALGGCICGTPNERTNLQDNDGETTVSVGAKKKHAVHITARAPGATLMWEFSVAKKGIEFSAAVTPEVGEPMTLAPVCKHRAEDGVIKGSVFVPVAGTVSVTFDNGHSRLTSKSVTYNVACIAKSVDGAGADAVVMSPAVTTEQVASADADAADDDDDDDDAEEAAETVAA
jgi:hypothetical protein